MLGVRLALLTIAIGLFTGALLTGPVHAVAPTVHHVESTGSDAKGDGSAERPWKTLGRACTSARPGDRIDMGPGTFIEPAPVRVPEGVAITGAGRGSTVLSLAKGEWAEFKLERFLLQFVSTGYKDAAPVVVGGFSVIGTPENPLSGGIVIRNRSRITVKDIAFNNVTWGALWIESARNTTVDGCDFTECGWGSDDYCTGAIMAGHVEDLDIGRFRIFARGKSTGYGIASIGFGRPRANWTRVKIHDGAIDLKPIGNWAGGKAPNISVEVNLAEKVVDSEIFGCTISNNISMVSGGTWKPTGRPSMRIHHNTFPMMPPRGFSYRSYLLECSIDDLELDHNYVDGSAYLVAGFYEPGHRNISIHHNTVVRAYAQYAPATIMLGRVANVSVHNNTFDWTSIGSHPGNAVISAEPGSTGLYVANNAFMWTKKQVIPLFKGNVEGLSVIGNALGNIDLGKDTAGNGGTIKGNPKALPEFVMEGAKPFPYYIPKDRNSGIGSFDPAEWPVQ